MERLTQRKNGGTFFSEDVCNMCGYAEKRSSTFCENLGCHSVIDRSCPYLQIIDRLAAYEDTGLTPEKIVAMKAELEAERYRHDRVQDFCTAEGELLSKAKRDLRDISACFTCTGKACGRGPATPAESGTRCGGYKWDSGVKDREGVEFDYGAED